MSQADGEAAAFEGSWTSGSRCRFDTDVTNAISSDVCQDEGGCADRAVEDVAYKAEAPHGQDERTAALLTRLTRKIIDEIFNSRKRLDTDFLKRHIASDFHGTGDIYHLITSREQLFAHSRAAAQRGPNAVWTVMNLSLELNTEARRATVWVLLAVGGATFDGNTGLSRETVIRYQWRQLQGRWLLVRQNRLRGAGLTLDVGPVDLANTDAGSVRLSPLRG